MLQRPRSINMEPVFSIVITTKDRLLDLQHTLAAIVPLVAREDTECIICDDGSTDGTAAYINQHYPHIQLLQHSKSKGLIYSRNRLFTAARGMYAITLDDDANFIGDDPCNDIQTYFNTHPQCAVISFRIFWGLHLPNCLITKQEPQRVKGFVGCGHVWRMAHWKKIPPYPSWFIFYGEEDFAAFQLFKQGLEVHYLPQVLTHHRVNIRNRKKNKDYGLRLRRSLRAGWYNYLLFYPLRYLPKRFLYTLWMQLKLKVFKGDVTAAFAILQALGDVVINIPRLIKQSNRFTRAEFKKFKALPDTKLYWKPEKHT